MVALILIIGIVNLALGYGLAIWLGYVQMPALSVGWSLRRASAPAPGVPAASVAVPAAEPLRADKPPPPAVEPPASEAAEEEPWTLDETHVEASVLRLNLAMVRSMRKLTEIDAQLRACSGEYDRRSLEQCAENLLADCQIYLAEQGEAVEGFHSRAGELSALEALTSLVEQIELTNLEQSAQIETTISNLQHIDFDAGLEAAAKRILDEIDGLRAARHRIRDGQESAFVTIARQQGRLAEIDAHVRTDPLTGLPNRIGVEATLAAWSAEGRLESHALAAALVEVDDFGRLNKTYGPGTADHLLIHVGQQLRDAAGQTLVARYSGQRFLLLALDSDARTFLDTVEAVRQSIAQASFARGTQTIEVTVSGAVAAVPPGGDPGATLEQLQETLLRARETGSDQVFLWEDGSAQKIDSPAAGQAAV